MSTPETNPENSLIEVNTSLITIKPAGKGTKDKVKIDRRSITSAKNAIKNFKYTETPMQCNYCRYGNVLPNGLNVCKESKRDSVCFYKMEDIAIAKQFNTRSVEGITEMNGIALEEQWAAARMATRQAMWEGGVFDKVRDRQLEIYVKLANLQKELLATPDFKARETTVGMDSRGNIFQQVRELAMKKAQMIQQEQGASGQS